MKNLKTNGSQIYSIYKTKIGGENPLENIKEMLLKLLELNEKDKEEIKNYLEANEIDILFKNYKALDISDDAKEQIDSLKVILENFKDQ